MSSSEGWYYNSRGHLTAVASMRATSTILAHRHYWTWREAIEVATRANSTEKPTVRRDGDRWLVTYRARLTLMNAG